ncbi:Emp24/gp25L/p24 family protein [Opisthorchis viverrini]|uniref:Emp24/gp25L/p24 family protein n=1 Tax=Opisthorchis viverrini TaxID=6198 RepID=A0A1S8X9N3_OPIVI|nr:Emp24/gp25L/p24 family protein [Opisthorchis viverrini]
MTMWLFLALSLFSWRPCWGFYVDIDANGVECFIERIPANKKFTLHYEVAEGGFLDIDAAVYGPDGKLMYNEIKKPNGRPKFVASKAGSYKYCFGNKMSSLTPKVVLFELEVEEDHLQAEDEDDGSHFDGVRCAARFLVNQNTNFRVVLWAAFEAVLIITMSIGQVFYLKRFFEVRRLV